MLSCVAERRQGRIVALDDARRREMLNANARLAQGAIRVLGLAYRQDPLPSEVGFHESELILPGSWA